MSVRWKETKRKEKTSCEEVRMLVPWRVVSSDTKFIIWNLTTKVDGNGKRVELNREGNLMVEMCGC